MIRRVVAVDIDEVLCPFLVPMLKHNRAKIPNQKFPYVFKDVLGITEKESQKMVYDFYASKEFSELEPIEGSKNGLVYLKTLGYDIYAVTGRQDIVRNTTETWLQKHFPWVMKDLIMTNSYTPHEVNKADICKSLGTHLVIDDNYKTCLEAEALHIRGINFIGDPVYPWCMDNPIAVGSWRDIMRL